MNMKRLKDRRTTLLISLKILALVLMNYALRRLQVYIFLLKSSSFICPTVFKIANWISDT